MLRLRRLASEADVIQYCTYIIERIDVNHHAVVHVV